MAKTPIRPSAPPSRNGIRIAALAGLALATVLSIWLTYQSWGGGTVPGCEGGNCAAVLGSKWAKVMGVPVGLFGAAAYGLLAIVGPQAMARAQRGPRIVAAALMFLIPAAALWFASLQLFVLKAFCPWCTLTHALAVAGVICMALSWRCDAADPRVASRKGAKHRRGETRIWGAATACAVVAFAGFVLAQALGPEPPKPQVVTASMPPPPSTTAEIPAAAATLEPVISPPSPSTTEVAATPPSPPPAAKVEEASHGRRLSLHGGRFHLDPMALPVMGRADAPHMVVMISDYTCRYCRAAHRILHEVRESFDPGQLGFVMLPTHNGGDSMEIQRLMLAAWKLDPAVWESVADDLYSERMSIQSAAVKTVLDQRLGVLPLQTSLAVNAPWITEVFGITKDIYTANRAIAKRGSIPQFIIGQEIVVGAPADAAEFYDLFAQHLGLVRENLPELLLANAEFDLGRVFAGTPQPVTVPFSNPGKAPLQISRANLSQGGRVSRGLNTPVAPGQSSILELSIPVPVVEGPFEESVTLFSNARTSAAPIRVKGTSWKPLKIQPDILDFGRTSGLNVSTQGVMRIEFAEEAFIDSLRSQNPAFTASLREIAPGRSYDVVVRTTPRLGSGAQQSAILVGLRKPVPEGWPESLALAARIVVERAVTVVPPRLMVPAGVLSTERHQQVLVRCLDGTPGFNVRSAVLEGGPAFTLPEIRRGTGTNDYVVLVSLPAGWEVPAAPLGAKLVLETTHPEYPRLEVPVVAQGR